MKPTKLFVAILLVMLPLCLAYAILGSMPSLQALLQSDVIVLVESKDMETIAKGPSIALQIKEARVLRGQCPSELNLTGQTFPLAPGKAFVIFLSSKDKVLTLSNQSESIIPYSSPNVFPNLKGADTLSNAICDAFTHESDPDCSLVQSALIATLDREVLEKNRATLMSVSSSDSDLINLARVNVKLRLDGVEALRDLKNVQPDAKQSPAGKREVNLYAERVRGSLLAWVDQYSSATSYSDLVHFLRKQDAPFNADILTAIAPHASAATLPQVVEMFLSSKDPMVLYACIQNISKVLRDNEDVPTVELFLTQPAKYIAEWKDLLAKEGYLNSQ